LSYSFEYAVLEEADKNANTNFTFDVWDTYQWYLGLGPLSAVNDRVLHGKIKYWNELVAHPDYDDFWRQQAWLTALRGTPVPTLNVAGFWDQEDPWGPWQIFAAERRHDPDHTALMVAGPWRHGGWHRDTGSHLGPIDLGHETSREFRSDIEAPFFAYWLHDKGVRPDWQARMFQTGSNRWQSYAAWPPAESRPTRLYLRADGSLSFDAPAVSERGRHRDWRADPAHPVPYRPLPISPTYPGGDWPWWEWDDQRFVADRPDVLTFTSAPLDHDLTVSGAVAAEIFASTSGSDSDLVVKLIDVFPEDAEKPTWSDADGPGPGDYRRSVNGYQLPIAMEVRRGRYLASDQHPRPLPANQPVLWRVPLRDRNHVFGKGHRIMLQLQSSWFPLIDRNPQTFTASIFSAKPADFVAVTQKVYTSPTLPSAIILPLMPESIK
jgi:putative CocE/NonD family hydrolase